MSLDSRGNPSESVPLALTNPNLGRVTVWEDQIITFSPGLGGFVKFRRYTLLERPQELPFLWFLCVDKPDLAFVVMDPVNLVADYQVRPSASILKELSAESPQDLIVLVILTIPAGRPQDTTANLMAPLLIKARLNRGKQVVLEKPSYSQAHPIFSR